MTHELSLLVGGQSFPPTPMEFASSVNSCIAQNWWQIQNGYNNPFSSTMTPMSQLHGAAYDVALMSNIGIPRNQGGTGMRGGYEATMNYAVGQALWAGFNICCWYYGLPMLPPPSLT